MYSKLFLPVFLIYFVSTFAYTNRENIDLMGIWQVQSVSLIDENLKPGFFPNQEYYEFAQFNFKGNGMYFFSYGPNTPQPIKNTTKSIYNWLLSGETIKIGHMLNGYASQYIQIEIEDDEIYFLMSNLKLKVKRISKDKSVEKEKSDYVKIWFEYMQSNENANLNRSIDASNTYPLEEIDYPPLANKCKSKWSLEKQKQCFSEYINRQVNHNLGTRKISRHLQKESEIISFEVSFIIDTNGKPANIHVYGTGSDVLIEEVLKAIHHFKEMSPATIDSKPVNVFINLPIQFMVN